MMTGLDRRELVDVLSSRLRCMALPQVARTAFPDSINPLGAANRWVRRMESNHRLVRTHVPAHPEIPVADPLHSHVPGLGPPDFDRLAWAAQSRWKLPAVMTTLVSVPNSELRPVRLREAAHDIHLAAVYLGLSERDPESISHWVLEPQVLGNGSDKKPDAILAITPPLIIEFIGSYSAAKLRRMHSALNEHAYRWY